MLRKLINKNNLFTLGINSGTSCDSLDLAVVLIRDKKPPRFLTGKTVNFPPKLKEKIFSLCDTKNFSLDDVIYLDNYLGKFIGRAACKYISELKTKKIAIDLIASHGQTIRHRPKKIKFIDQMLNGTLQLGSPEFIAQQTGKVVVADFRQADVALGNEGAPITTFALENLLPDSKQSKLIVNIGGMSNLFYFPKDKKQPVLSADCGPGNVLSDLLSQKLFSKQYDHNGRMAQKGEISQRLLSLLLAQPFFKDKTISTGRESFGRELAEKIIKYKKQLKLSNLDLIATASELTIRSINSRLKPLIAKNKEIKKLYLTGGGRKNIFFKRGLKQTALEVGLIEELGIDGDYTEAACYAIMGAAALRSETMTSHIVNKNKLRPVLGRIIQPPK